MGTVKVNRQSVSFGEPLSGVEILRSGRHRASDGQAYDVSREMISAIAKAYDPALHEAPATIGHPKDNAPAYGWVTGLRAEGDLLKADFDVIPEFKEALRQGLFKKRSASLYPDLEGRGWYLRHVGFLGGTPPAIKGLEDIAFGDARDAVTIDFNEEQRMSWKDLFKRAVDEMPEGAAPMVIHQPQPAVATLGVSFGEEEVARRVKDAEEAAARKARDEAALEFAEERKRAESEALAKTHKTDVKSRLDALMKDGCRVTPAMMKDGLAEFCEHLAFVPNSALDFAESGKKPPWEWLSAFMEKHFPRTVDFGEHAGSDTDIPTDAESRRDLAIAYFMEKNKDCTYRGAVLGASKKHPELFRRQG